MLLFIGRAGAANGSAESVACAGAGFADASSKDAMKVRSPLSLNEYVLLKLLIPFGRLSAFSPWRVTRQLPSASRTKYAWPIPSLGFGGLNHETKAISPLLLIIGGRKLENSSLLGAARPSEGFSTTILSVTATGSSSLF